MFFPDIYPNLTSIAKYLPALSDAVQQAALDESDRRVLDQLRSNSRSSLKEIAQKTGLRPSTVFNRIRRMSDAGVIERFTIRVNPQAVGEDFVVFVLVSGLPEKFADEWLLRNRHVAEAYGVTGEYDLLIKLRFAGKAEFNDFIIE